MKIIFIGDVSARPGRLGVKAFLEEYRSKADIVIANCENAAHGIGATKDTIEELISYGVDYFTSGNDIWHQSSFASYLNEEGSKVIRPLNYPEYFPGRGYIVFEKNGKNILLINLIGTVFMKEEVFNPFRSVQDFLMKVDTNQIPNITCKIDLILVDFHAEATSEKVTMGYFLDGKVSAVLGTHTHVQTADERILNNKTAYITDVGMAGSLNSVLWVSYNSIIEKMMNPYKFTRFEVEEKKPWLVNAVMLDFDEENVAKSIERIGYIVN